MKKIQIKLLAVIIIAFAVTISLAQDERPAWQNIELINVIDGEAFTLGGFEDKLVFVEPMATWCGNCRAQLKNVSATQAIAGEDIVFVALSLEANIANEKLAAYAQKEGFEFVFTKVNQELLQALVDTFGRSVASPPSTPHFIIKTDGSTTEIVTGRESAEVLLAQIEAARQ